VWHFVTGRVGGVKSAKKSDIINEWPLILTISISFLPFLRVHKRRRLGVLYSDKVYSDPEHWLRDALVTSEQLNKHENPTKINLIPLNQPWFSGLSWHLTRKLISINSKNKNVAFAASSWRPRPSVATMFVYEN